MRLSFFLPVAAIFVQPVAAEGWQERVETDLSAEAALVLGIGQGELAGIADAESGLFELALSGGGETVLDNGTLVGVRLAVRVQQDHSARQAGLGVFPGASLEPAGVASGLGRGPEGLESGARGQLETAYLYIEGGYGEVSIGRDLGMAARVFEGDVGAFSHAGLANARLDPSGLAVIATRADLTGPSTKISYASPRYLGAQLGVSFTPEADVRGLDRDATGEGGESFARLENVIELGANLSRRLPESDVRLRAGLSYAHADIAPPEGFAGAFADSAEDWSAGVEIERGDWRAGASWRSADEGVVGRGDYTAWTVGLAHERGDWTGSVTYGEAEIGALEAESEAISVELHRTVGDVLQVGLAWQSRNLDPLAVSNAGDGPSGRRSGLVVEITLFWENATISEY